MSEPEVPWIKLIGYGLGSAVGVLIVAAGLIALLDPGPVVGLLIAGGGLVGCVVALAVVSRRITLAALDRAEQPDP